MPGPTTPGGAQVLPSSGTAPVPTAVAVGADNRTPHGSDGGPSGIPTTGPVPGLVAAGGGTPQSVRIGFFISDDASQIYKTLGISGASHTRAESQRIWQAVIDQVNGDGGLAGRRIVPSYAWITSDSGTNATRSQAACDQFTHDTPVFAVVVDGATDLSAATCFAQHHVVVVDVGQTSYPYDDVDLRALAPYAYVPGRLSMSRFATYVDELAGHGFFTRTSKVALLRFDLPDQKRTAQSVVAPALRRLGLRLDLDVRFTPVEGTADLPRAADESSAAVLRMRAAGIDRVLFLGSGLSLSYVFPTVAESQGYRPRYGFTTDDGPDFTAGNAPATQLSGALAVGWEPQYDVPDSDAVLAHDALWQRCARRMRAAGFTARDGRRCTALYFLHAALAGASDASAAAVRAGADRLGPGEFSTQNYATRLRPHRYDGAGAVRVLQFAAACTCFRYVTGDVLVP